MPEKKSTHEEEIVQYAKTYLDTNPRQCAQLPKGSRPTWRMSTGRVRLRGRKGHRKAFRITIRENLLQRIKDSCRGKGNGQKHSQG